MEKKEVTKRRHKAARAKDDIPCDRTRSHEYSFGVETKAGRPPKELL